METKHLNYRQKRLPLPLPLVGRGAGWGSTHLGRLARIQRAITPLMLVESLLIENAMSLTTGAPMSQSPLSMKKRTTVYRYLTGPDDSAFCHKVSAALSKGWLLYGSPTLTFDPVQGRVICGQAVTKEVEDIAYNPELKLGEL